MVYVVKRGNGSWEIRESRQTEKGPRSFTLATLRETSPEVLERARQRSKSGFLESELALKLDEAGVPPAMTDVDRAARTLLLELAGGGSPSEALRRALLQRLDEAPGRPPEKRGSPAARVELKQQGRRFEDVLDLASELPYQPSEQIAQIPLRDLIDTSKISG